MLLVGSAPGLGACADTAEDILETLEARCTQEGLEVINRGTVPREIALLQISRHHVVPWSHPVRTESREIPIDTRQIAVAPPTGEAVTLGPALLDVRTLPSPAPFDLEAADREAAEGRPHPLLFEGPRIAAEAELPQPTNRLRFLLRLGPTKDSPKAVGRCSVGEPAKMTPSR